MLCYVSNLNPTCSFSFLFFFVHLFTTSQQGRIHDQLVVACRRTGAVFWWAEAEMWGGKGANNNGWAVVSILINHYQVIQ